MAIGFCLALKVNRKQIHKKTKIVCQENEIVATLWENILVNAVKGYRINGWLKYKTLFILNPDIDNKKLKLISIAELAANFKVFLYFASL